MIEFVPDMLMNVALIDEQHMDLVKRINEVVTMGSRAANREEIEKSLVFLANYVVKHFGDEEKVQLQIGYPKYQQHRQQHLLFIEDYKKFLMDYKQNGSSTNFMLQLNRAVIRWVVQHLQGADAELAKYIKTHRITVAPIE